MNQSAPNQQKDPFSLIKIPSEKKRIYRELIESKSELVLKGKNDTIYRLRADRMAEGGWILCAPEKVLLESEVTNFEKEHCVNFAVGTDRFFMNASLTVQKPWILLETNCDLYMLQRRKTMRILIPEEMDTACNVLSKNSQSSFVITKVLDYAVGGLRLLLPAGNNTYKANDQLNLSVRLGARRPFEVRCVVRHCMPPTAENKDLVFGVEFLEKDRILENKLLALQMDLQSEIFRKWKRHEL